MGKVTSYCVNNGKKCTQKWDGYLDYVVEMEPDNRCLISLPVSRPLPSSDYSTMATTVLLLLLLLSRFSRVRLCAAP